MGGLSILVCAYVLRVHRKNELALQAVCQEDLITEWAHPSPAMQSAATLIQGNFRQARPHVARLAESGGSARAQDYCSFEAFNVALFLSQGYPTIHEGSSSWN